MSKKITLTESTVVTPHPLGKIVSDSRLTAFSTKQFQPISMKQLVREALAKDKMNGTIDQWASYDREPISPEYNPIQDDDTKGDAAPPIQHKKDKVKKQKEPKFIKLSGLLNIDSTRDATTETPNEIDNKKFDDTEAGVVCKEDKHGIPQDLPAMQEDSDRGNIKLSNLIKTKLHPVDNSHPIPSSKTDVPASPIQNKIVGTPSPEQVMKLNNTSGILELRDKVDSESRVTQVVKTPDGMFQVGIRVDGVEHIGTGLTASEAARKAALIAVGEKSNAL